MTTIELSLNPEYVPDWDLWEAVRELLQNALDANDQGCPMRIDHKPDTQQLFILNRKANLQRDTLLLGRTSKLLDDKQRGQFGEGYKLALLVLSRLGYRTIVYTREETWLPEVSHSATFGADTLKINITPADKVRPGLGFIVEGVSADSYAEIQQRCFALQPPDPAHCVNTKGGTILMAPEHKGLLFAGGLYVCKLPDEYGFGYDLPKVKLDRDRRLADPWSIRSNVGSVLCYAMTDTTLQADVVLRLLETECGEALALRDFWRIGRGLDVGDKLATRVANEWLQVHGENAVPVANLTESIEAQAFGFNGVVSKPAVIEVVGSIIGSYQERKKQEGLRVKHVYSANELTEAELDTFVWGMRLFDDGVCNVRIVDFVSDTLRGLYQRQDRKPDVMVARKELADRARFVETLVHELCHVHGADGSLEHVMAIQHTFAQLVATKVP